MSASQPKVLVLAGDGLNGELELAHAFQMAGFSADIQFISDLVKKGFNTDVLCHHFSVLAIPGGYSYGDELGSGKVLALKMSQGLGIDFQLYANRGGLVLGVGNGFQALLRLGVFGKDLSIMQNSGGSFLNQWVRLQPNSQRSVWLKGLGNIDLPIRHSQGRIMIGQSRRAEVLSKLERYGMMCLKYETDVNGSDERLAGLCDHTGHILGLMPHPELFLRWTSHPEWTASPGRANSPGQGLAFFENAYQVAVRNHL